MIQSFLRERYKAPKADVCCFINPMKMPIHQDVLNQASGYLTWLWRIAYL